MKAAFAQSVLDSANGLFDEIIDIEATGGRRRLSGAGVAISYTGVRRIDGTETAEADSADLLQQSTEALKTAVDDGSFLSTLQAADSAFAAVTVDETATYAAIAAATVVFVVTTPAPTTSAPSLRPTSRPSPAPSPRPTATPSSGAPGGAAGDDDGAAPAAAAAAAPAPASGGGGSDSGGGTLIIIVVLVVVILMLLSGIGGYLVSTRRGSKISAVAVAVEPVEDGELTTDRWATARREERCMKASPRVLPMVTPTDAAATHFPRPDDGDRVTPEDAAATHFPPSGAPRRQAPDLEDQV